MMPSNKGYGSMVPFHFDMVNPFNDDYSFHGRVDQSLFPRDDFFHNFHSTAHEQMKRIQRSIMDDSFLDRFSVFPHMSSMLSFPRDIDFKDPKGASHMHQTTQMMSYSNIDGKKKLVQSHDEKEMGPGGVWRTRKAHRDTSKNIEKMQEGLFIGDKGEIRERYRNPQTGQLEEQLYLRNIPQEYRQQFVDEWNRKAADARNSYKYPIYSSPRRQNSTQHIPIQY